MSDEINSLKTQLDQKEQAINGLLAQLDAHRGVMNESLNASLQLRTNFVVIQKNNLELNQKLSAANERIKELEKQNATDQVSVE